MCKTCQDLIIANSVTPCEWDICRKEWEVTQITTSTGGIKCVCGCGGALFVAINIHNGKMMPLRKFCNEKRTQSNVKLTMSIRKRKKPERLVFPDGEEASAYPRTNGKNHIHNIMPIT